MWFAHIAHWVVTYKEINNQGKENVKRQFANKRSLIYNFSIFEFFVSKDPFEKDDVEQKVFVEICTFNGENSFAFTICEKCVVKMFSIIIMSLCVIPFSKIIFKHCFA